MFLILLLIIIIILLCNTFIRNFLKRAEPPPEFWEVVAVEDGGLWVPVPALEVPRGRVSQAAVPCTHRSARAQRRCHLPQGDGQRDGPAGGERHPQVGS